MEIQYVTIEGIDKKYFKCDRLRATMPVESCVDRYKRCSATERFITCHRCPVGAYHVGKPLEVHSLLRSRMCARCFKLSARVVGGRLCVSCYNRTLETQRGQNAKGSSPKKLAAVFTGFVQVKLTGGQWAFASVELTSMFVETLVSAARQHEAELFSWASGLQIRLSDSTLRRGQPCN